MEKIDYISKSVLLHKLDQLETLLSQIREERHKPAMPDWIVVEGLDLSEFLHTNDIENRNPAIVSGFSIFAHIQ